MRHLKNLLLMVLLPLVAVVLFASCDKDPDVDKGNGTEQTPSDDPNDDPNDDPEIPDEEKDSSIVLSKKSVSAPVSGGTCFVEYEITNPHQGEKISLEFAEDWISDVDTSLSGAFSFKVTANDGDNEREALVTVKYRYANDVTFTVKQGARTGDGFSVEQVTGRGEYYSYTVNVYPENKTMPFIMMSASKSYIEAYGLETDEELFADDYSFFEYLGGFHGKTAVEVMQDRARSGNQTNITLEDATPGEPMVFYCYYFDYDSGSLMSDIYRFDITVEHPEVTTLPEGYFTFNYEITGPRVKTKVTSSTEVDYYFDVMTEAELIDAEKRGYTKEEYIKLWWASIAAQLRNGENYNEYTIIQMNTCQGTTTDDNGVTRDRSEWTYDLLANTNYYLFAFNFGESALCVTTPQMVKFTTGAVEPSDNQLTIAVSDITSYRATVDVTATYEESEENYRHAYVTDIATKDEWNSYGNNDAARMNYIKNNISLEYMWGDKTLAYSNLEPGTEYVAYAFGLYGGVVTTQLWTASFTTVSDDPGEVNISLKDLGYYDPADLAVEEGLEFFGNESYSGKAILPLSIEFSKKNHGDFFIEIYDWTGRNDEYSDEQYLSGLIWQIETYGSYSTTNTYTMLNWDGRYVIVGIVVDANGRYSELMKYEYKPTYAGAESDISKFTSWWNSWNGGIGLQSVVINEASTATKGDVIEVDASISKRKAIPTYLKASQREFTAKKETPEVTKLSANR